MIEFVVQSDGIVGVIVIVEGYLELCWEMNNCGEWICVGVVDDCVDVDFVGFFGIKWMKWNVCECEMFGCCGFCCGWCCGFRCLGCHLIVGVVVFD